MNYNFYGFNKMITQQELNKLTKSGDIDLFLEGLLSSLSEAKIKDIVHDAILVDTFFPRLGDHFKTGLYFTSEELDSFKEEVDLEDLGVSEDLRDSIRDMKNIDRIIDTIVDNMSEKKRMELAKEHLKNKWYHENFQGNLQDLVKNLKPDFWDIY